MPAAKIKNLNEFKNEACRGCTELLFVYGTLKKGFKLNATLGNSPFEGEVLAAGYRLLSCGYFSPIIEEDGCAVSGDLYRKIAVDFSDGLKIYTWVGCVGIIKSKIKSKNVVEDQKNFEEVKVRFNGC